MKKIIVAVLLLFLTELAYAQAEIEKYQCIEVKTDLIGDEIQYSIKKQNSVELTLKNCIPESLNIHVKNRDILYKQSRRLIEDGRIEKNDLFIAEYYEPFPEDGNLIDYEGINLRFYRGRLSHLITPEYPLYPTLKQTADKLNIPTPHRTFIIFSGLGGSSHEFFCYIDEKLSKMPSKDTCAYAFDEILDIHSKNQNTVALSELAKKYFKRQDYEKAGKAYRKLIEQSDNEGYEGLLSLYIATEQYNKAKEVLFTQLKNSPYDAMLYTFLAKIYLHERDYDKVESVIHKALKLKFEKGEYEADGILGQVYIDKRNYKDAVIYFEKASELFKKECEDNKLFSTFFNRELPPVDCELQALPYQLKIIYTLTELEDFNRAEKMAKDLFSKAQNNPYLYGNLSYIYAGKGAFDKAIEMTDKAISLFKHRGIGANIVMGEIYPMVTAIDKDTPAERGGLKKGDKIINIGNKDLRLFRQGGDIIQMFVDYINNNETVRLKIHREKSIDLKELELKPTEILKPATSELLAFKALIHRVNGKHSEFEKLALKAYELNPEDNVAKVTKALLKSDQGEYDESANILEKARKDNQSSLILLIRPIIYAKTGQINKAKEFYKEIPQELLITKNALYKVLLREINSYLQQEGV